MKPRILAVIHMPPPVHGTTMMNSYFADSRLLKESFNIRIIPIRFVKVVSQSGRFAFGKLVLTGRLLLAILKELIFFRPALVYMTPAPTGWAFYRDLLLAGIIKLFPSRLILHLHGQGIQAASRTAWKKALYKRFFSGVDVICVSERLFFDIQDVFPGTPYAVPNALPEREGPQVERNCQKGTRPPQILYLSNLTEGKGLIEFLDALQILKETRKIEFCACIAGSPNDITKEQLENGLKQRDLAGCVEYVGPQYGDDKHRRFAQADLFVFPTKIDVFGMVLLEAMQHALPVVASRMAAIPDVVQDGETGFLVDPGNVQDLAEKMACLAVDPVLRECMGQRGFEHYKAGFTTGVFERNLKTVFESVLKAVRMPSKSD